MSLLILLDPQCHCRACFLETWYQLSMPSLQWDSLYLCSEWSQNGVSWGQILKSHGHMQHGSGHIWSWHSHIKIAHHLTLFTCPRRHWVRSMSPPFWAVLTTEKVLSSLKPSPLCLLDLFWRDKEQRFASAKLGDSPDAFWGPWGPAYFPPAFTHPLAPQN